MYFFVAAFGYIGYSVLSASEEYRCTSAFNSQLVAIAHHFLVVFSICIWICICIFMQDKLDDGNGN